MAPGGSRGGLGNSRPLVGRPGTSLCAASVAGAGVKVPVHDPASSSFYCHGVEPLDPARMVEHLKQGIGKHDQIRHVQEIPDREASLCPLPSHLPPIGAASCSCCQRPWSAADASHGYMVGRDRALARPRRRSRLPSTVLATQISRTMEQFLEWARELSYKLKKVLNYP